MSPSSANPSLDSSGLTLRFLVQLRFVAIAGQAAAIAVAVHWLGLAIPWRYLLLILAALLAYNLLTARSLRRGGSVSFKEQLWVDCCALTLVLGLTGGGTNPFAWLLLLPLVFAALTLSRAATWLFGGFTATCYTVVTFVHVPLPGMPSLNLPAFRLHVLGMWAGFVICAVAIVYFVADMAHALRRRDRELAAAREQALRNDHLLGLGIVAAGAAHELGTPLSTMAVLIQELGNHLALRQDAEAQEQIDLLRRQIGRCKQTLAVLSAAACDEHAGTPSAMTLGDYLERLVAQWQRPTPKCEVVVECYSPDRDARIVASFGLSQTLANLLQNAAESSHEPIVLSAFHRDGRFVVRVRDRGTGPGGIGDTRRPVRSTKGLGRGLGLYLARGFVEQVGGELAFSAAPGGGTVAEVTLPLSAATMPEAAHG